MPDDVIAVLCLAPRATDPAMASAKCVRADVAVEGTERAADAADAKKLHAAILEARKGDAASARPRIVENPPSADGVGAIDVRAGSEAFGKAPLLEAHVAGLFARDLAAIPNEVVLDGDLTTEGAAGRAWTKAAAPATSE